MTNADYDVRQNLRPEAKARLVIDQKLNASGWIIQNLKPIDLSAGPGVAVREYPTDSGRADYILFVDREPVGVVEAKGDAAGYKITDVEGQTLRYAEDELKHIKDHKELPFCYEATGILTRFTDRRDPAPRSRKIFTFHRPETLREYLRHHQSLRARLRDLPQLDETGLRACQIRAINNLDISFRESRPRALIQMATGAGKTFTAVTAAFRLECIMETEKYGLFRPQMSIRKVK